MKREELLLTFPGMMKKKRKKLIMRIARQIPKTWPLHPKFSGSWVLTLQTLPIFESVSWATIKSLLSFGTAIKKNNMNNPMNLGLVTILFSSKISWLPGISITNLSYGRILTLHYYFLLMCILFSIYRFLGFTWDIINCTEIMLCRLFLFLFRDLSFGIRKLHQIHFVFLLIVLGY